MISNLSVCYTPYYILTLNHKIKQINGEVTTHSRATKDENSGFAFVNCTLGGTSRNWLGRAWRPYSMVVFANTFMTDIVAPKGWNDLNDPMRDQLRQFFMESTIALEQDRIWR
ncbi:hypothetical protein H5410_037549 [Solanum commersonii]|uniref:pectinesterase n=1 Tax=Solanum commersonii TaxID=4109 RepID=A0A9J5Y855_SOLCO|nr:hypothetical protein H5410_037549 [Solanum commersonii]